MPDEEIFIALLHSYEHVRTHTHAHEAKKGWYGGGSYSPMHGEGGCVVAFSKDRMSRCSGKPHLHKIFTFPEVVYRSMRWYGRKYIWGVEIHFTQAWATRASLANAWFGVPRKEARN